PRPISLANIPGQYPWPISLANIPGQYPWPKPQANIPANILTRKVAWPWASARCTGNVAFDRATLVKGITLPQFEANFRGPNFNGLKFQGPRIQGTKWAASSRARRDTSEVRLQIQPKVTFKQGKAVKASLNWGKIERRKLASACCQASSRTTLTSSFIR